METKPFYKSKTFWLGIIEIAIGFLNYLQGELSSGGTITLMGILTILLRLVTNKAITLK